MRVLQAFLRSASHGFTSRSPFLAGAMCVALTVSGCSWLGASKDKAPPEPAAGAKADATDGSGVQTTRVTGLQKFLWVFSPYRPDIQQGNFVSQEMLAQLKQGMTRDQVRFLLGTPLVADIFHADRWDYPFRLERGNGELTTSRVTVYFKDDKLARFDGGNLPTEKQYIARIAGPVKAEPKGEPKKDDARATINIGK